MIESESGTRSDDDAQSDDDSETIAGPIPLVLSEEVVLDALKEKNPEKVVHLEFIFERITNFGDLTRFTNLRQLYLIDTGMIEIPNLTLCKGSLEVLNISLQSLQKIDNLSEFVNLKELYLNNNKITKIENLEKCTKLQKLWLFSNSISQMENLEKMTDLRELWLQDNQISAIPEYVRTLVNINVLHLAANKIEDIKMIQFLAELPCLNELSFGDRHFKGCPLTLRDNYRNFVTFHMKQLQILDGVPIQESDRAQVQDLYEQTVRTFNLKLELLKKQSKEQLKTIENRKTSLDQKSTAIKKQLLESLQSLENLIAESRTKASKENSTFIQAKQDKRKAYDKILNNLKKKYGSEIEKCLQKEASRLKTEEKYFNQFKKQTETESQEELLLQTLQKKESLSIYALDHSTTEYKFIKAYCKEQSVQLYKLLNAYKVVNIRTYLQFEKLASNGTTHRLFYVGTQESIHRAILNGFTESPVVMHGDITDTHLRVKQDRFPLALCQVRVNNILSIQERMSESMDISQIVKKLPVDCQACKFKYTNGKEMYLILRPSQIYIEYYLLLCVGSLYVNKPQTLEHLQSILSQALTTTYFTQLERKLEEEFKALTFA